MTILMASMAAGRLRTGAAVRGLTGGDNNQETHTQGTKLSNILIQTITGL